MSKSDSTLHDVAARVGVSTRTVSRVVNQEGGFSTDTEAKVRAAIDELGYRPNLLARGLITKRSGTIGLIGGSMLDPFFPELAQGVQQAGRESGLTLFFAADNDDPEHQQQALDSLIGRAVDGIIVFPARGRLEPIRRAAASGVPVVTINPPELDPTLHSISSDIVGGAMLAVDHLRKQGRRIIAFLGNRSPYSGQREQGYRQAIRAAGAEAIVLDVDPSPDGAMAGVEELLKRRPDVDGLFTYNDVMAIAAIRKLTMMGRSVPDDISVVGFDNIGLSAHVNPPLTTIDLNQQAVGRAAVTVLESAIDHPDQPAQHVVQPVALMIRHSCGDGNRSRSRLLSPEPRSAESVAGGGPVEAEPGPNRHHNTSHEHS